jgi:hypothetical protein
MRTDHPTLIRFLGFPACVNSTKAAASPVLERMIEGARRGWDAGCTVRVLGAPADAVTAFLRFLYSSPSR